MRDPFKTVVLYERTNQVIGLSLLAVLALLGALSAFWPATYFTNGQTIEAIVLRVGTYSSSGAFGGDLPILTVRLPDGSIRQVKASWSSAGNCMPGSQVPIVQRGTALQVALRGCDKPTRSG